MRRPEIIYKCSHFCRVTYSASFCITSGGCGFLPGYERKRISPLDKVVVMSPYLGGTMRVWVFIAHQESKSYALIPLSSDIKGNRNSCVSTCSVSEVMYMGTSSLLTRGVKARKTAWSPICPAANEDVLLQIWMKRSATLLSHSPPWPTLTWVTHRRNSHIGRFMVKKQKLEGSRARVAQPFWFTMDCKEKSLFHQNWKVLREFNETLLISFLFLSREGHLNFLSCQRNFIFTFSWGKLVFKSFNICPNMLTKTYIFIWIWNV